MVEQDSLKQIRNKHLSDILYELRAKGDCSLAELTESTDGGLTTVKKCVFQAMELGMILEGDIGASTGGRKAKRYLINKNYQYFLLIIVDNNDLLCRIYDFEYKLCKTYSVQFQMDYYMDCVYKVIDRASEKYNLGTVCLSVPCVIKDGVILDWYYNRQMQGVNIRKQLEDKYPFNIIVQNDMKLAVIGEGSRQKQNVKDLVTIQLGHNGIGMAEMVNGHLVEGCSGFAGEIGFTSDLRKNVMGIAYPAKIVRNAIIYVNPELIVFYKSDRQNNFNQIFSAAVKGLPDFAVPRFEVSDDYIGGVVLGFKQLVDKYGYFKKKE